MARKPVPGQDNNEWGTVLNEYLAVEHDSQGNHLNPGMTQVEADARYASKATEATANRAETRLFDVRRFGAKCDGVTDDTVAVNDGLVAMKLIGGTLFFPPGTTLCLGEVVFPIYTDTTTRMRAVRLTGAGSNPSFGYAHMGGSVLDVRGGVDGRIKLLGHGHCEIDHLTIQDGSGQSVPLIYTTNTVLHLHHCRINGSKTGTTCDQDAIVFGGLGTTDDGTVNGPFQGYGSVVAQNEFQGIRRIALLRRSANGIVVRENAVASNCGSNLPGGACIEVNAGTVNQGPYGNVIIANTLEAINYPYLVKIVDGFQNTVAYNGFYDPTATTLAYIRLEANALNNLIIDGTTTPGVPIISDATGGKYTRITSNAGETTHIYHPVALGTAATGNDIPLSVGNGGTVGGVAIRHQRTDTVGTILGEFGGGTTYTALWRYGYGAGDGGFIVYDVAAALTRLLIKADGFTGIRKSTPKSYLDVGGAIATPVSATSTNVTLGANASVLTVDASASTRIITLPAASTCPGRHYTIKKTDASGNGVTVDPNGTETIDGATTKTITTQWGVLQITSDGANWLILNQIGTIS
jgi:hypothetical protein